jgi:acetyltransferase
MYVEDIGRPFCERTFTKPVVMLKAGRSDLGQKAALLHTGAMASNYAIFKGACRQHQVMYADDFREFFALIHILATQGLPAGGRTALITNGAGPSVLACDFIDATRNLSLAGQVVDLTGSATADDYLRALRATDADIVVLTFVFQDAPLAETLDALYEGLAHTDAFGVALAIGGSFVAEQGRRLSACGIPVFEEPGVAVRALDVLAGYAGRP